jgi:hypothetical protein
MNQSTNQMFRLLFFKNLNIGLIEIIMIEPRTVETNREYHLHKRLHDPEQHLFSKRIKCDTSESDEQCDSSSISDSETESKSSRSDTDRSDENSDCEDISTDQSRSIPVVFNEVSLHKPSFSRHSKRLIKQFQYLYEHSKRKTIEPTACLDEIINSTKKLRWELRHTFHRIDLLKEGYAVLSEESFPFYSLCYMVSLQQYEIMINTLSCLNF